ncbi:LacI family DNA-binding transcriptional regulator [Gynurincola endophyticus]|uniref:LacI family DNA-binding transcriptional regulator n=1 Tax=Gynurincola endophyticus TaxID=2479004 RepID=UPI000F8D4A70|nr:LacI family DNA-binding transcriptional regulator [Gynurincola endophyticus]
MRPDKEVTIYDIARTLNVSPATVSRGLKDHPAISTKTKRRILEKAKELGYRSNNFASNLRKQKTQTIGILLHELHSHFIVSVLAGIEKVTTEAGYDILIAHSSESGQKEVANAQNLFHKRVDGIIASLAFDTPDLSHFLQFSEKNIPIVFFDRVEEDSLGTKVIIDNYKAGYQATQHLLDQGCKRVIHITGNQSRNVYKQRAKGFKDALLDNNQEYNPANLKITDLDRVESEKVANEILNMQPRPDGVFCAGDFSAAVCMRVFKSAGLRIPEDIAIVGFNNDVICTLIEPQLTTINYPGVEMGEIAARILINHLNGNADITLTNSIIIKSDLIVRESSLRKPIE